MSGGAEGSHPSRRAHRETSSLVSGFVGDRTHSHSRVLVIIVGQVLLNIALNDYRIPLTPSFNFMIIMIQFP